MNYKPKEYTQFEIRKDQIYPITIAGLLTHNNLFLRRYFLWCAL